jgi:hypothetical protein
MHGSNQIGEKICMMPQLELWSKCVTNFYRMDLAETVKTFVNRGVFGTESQGPSGNFLSIMSPR